MARTLDIFHGMNEVRRIITEWQADENPHDLDTLNQIADLIGQGDVTCANCFKENAHDAVECWHCQAPLNTCDQCAADMEYQITTRYGNFCSQDCVDQDFMMRDGATRTFSEHADQAQENKRQDARDQRED